MPQPQISRRLLLGATTAVLLTACDTEPEAVPPSGRATDGGDPTAGGTGTAGTDVSGDDLLVANAAANTRGLAGAYAALVARHPDTRRATAPLRAHLSEHLDVLGVEGNAARRAPAARSRRQAVRVVLTAELAASAARIDDAVAAASGELARVLASIAACHAQHAIVLEEL